MDTNQGTLEARGTRFGSLQIAIVLLTLATALIHAVVLNVLLGTISPIFTLNGLGYLALLAALYLPIPWAKDNRNLVRWALIGYAAITILAWVAIGDKSWPGDALGYLTKAIEVVLIALLWVEARR